MHWTVPVIVSDIGVSLVFEEECDEGHVCALAGHVERGAALAVLLVAAGSRLQELFGLAQLALGTGLVQLGRLASSS